MKQRLFLAAFAACMAVCGWAQQQTPKSIVCNQDGTVTFTYIKTKLDKLVKPWAYHMVWSTVNHSQVQV